MSLQLNNYMIKSPEVGKALYISYAIIIVLTILVTIMLTAWCVIQHIRRRNGIRLITDAAVQLGDSYIINFDDAIRPELVVEECKIDISTQTDDDIVAGKEKELPPTAILKDGKMFIETPIPAVIFEDGKMFLECPLPKDEVPAPVEPIIGEPITSSPNFGKGLTRPPRIPLVCKLCFQAKEEFGLITTSLANRMMVRKFVRDLLRKDESYAHLRKSTIPGIIEAATELTFVPTTDETTVLEAWYSTSYQQRLQRHNTPVTVQRTFLDRLLGRKKEPVRFTAQ